MCRLLSSHKLSNNASFLLWAFSSWGGSVKKCHVLSHKVFLIIHLTTEDKNTLMINQKLGMTQFSTPGSSSVTNSRTAERKVDCLIFRPAETVSLKMTVGSLYLTLIYLWRLRVIWMLFFLNLTTQSSFNWILINILDLKQYCFCASYSVGRLNSIELHWRVICQLSRF